MSKEQDTAAILEMFGNKFSDVAIKRKKRVLPLAAGNTTINVQDAPLLIFSSYERIIRKNSISREDSKH